MTESAASSVGQLLREAREAQGITLEEVAGRLRLMHRQVEAMETDDFESLGQPVFARGFVRNYARLLGLDPEALLARMEGAPEEKPAVSPADSPPQHAWLTSPWLILLLLGVLLLLPHAPAASAQAIPSPSAPPNAPAPLAPPETGAAASVEPDAPAEPKPATVNSVLHLEFGDESWTEIKDASGHMLLRQLNPAGSSVDVRGQPPFEVVIGNANLARMSYNGRPIDLNPFIDVTVARFTLEE
jgi:cytoskeleton protein RodZ